MLEFQTKGGVVICSFPLLDHCYCVLHHHFSLGSTYESLSSGAKARIDGVSYQCLSGKLTYEWGSGYLTHSNGDAQWHSRRR